MTTHKKERIDEIKHFKKLNKSMRTLYTQNDKQELVQKVKKRLEKSNNIMKREQDEEKKRNLKMLNYLNKKEKRK
jgi:phosphomevalonate kinase